MDLRFLTTLYIYKAYQEALFPLFLYNMIAATNCSQALVSAWRGPLLLGRHDTGLRLRMRASALG